MYIIVMQFNGRYITIISTNKTTAMLAKQGYDPVTWRAHDGTGWCDGSSDAYKDIPHLIERGHVVYTF